tara:strand:- start:1107 stop:1382 length:276 start_codon:yes stop_codon:yes gene_type:complete
MSEEKSRESLIDFPCEFPIKILGKDSDIFENTVSKIMAQHDQKYSKIKVKKNNSKNKNYIALTWVVNVNNRDELDNIYRDLSKEKNILFVL